jgi:hypothetical protein
VDDEDELVADLGKKRVQRDPAKRAHITAELHQVRVDITTVRGAIKDLEMARDNRVLQQYFPDLTGGTVQSELRVPGQLVDPELTLQGIERCVHPAVCSRRCDCARRLSPPRKHAPLADCQLHVPTPLGALPDSRIKCCTNLDQTPT